jgi:hypothetical protein
VILFFSAAMLVMAGSFGLWRAGIISKAAFAAGVAAVVLVLLGGTTWARHGFWAPEGGYAIVSGFILYVWVAVVSGFLVIRGRLRPARLGERRCPRRSSERRGWRAPPDPRRYKARPSRRITAEMFLRLLAIGAAG